MLCYHKPTIIVYKWFSNNAIKSIYMHTYIFLGNNKLGNQPLKKFLKLNLSLKIRYASRGRSKRDRVLRPSLLNCISAKPMSMRKQALRAQKIDRFQN